MGSSSLPHNPWSYLTSLQGSNTSWIWNIFVGESRNLWLQKEFSQQQITCSLYNLLNIILLTGLQPISPWNYSSNKILYMPTMVSFNLQHSRTPWLSKTIHVKTHLLSHTNFLFFHVCWLSQFSKLIVLGLMVLINLWGDFTHPPSYMYSMIGLVNTQKEIEGS